MLNKVLLIGHVGQDPEIKVAGDSEFAVFSLATSESWKDKETGEKKQKSEWHRIVTFQEGLLKVIKQYVNKGSKLFIEGQLKTRKWDDNGVDKYSTEIVIGARGKIVLLDAKGDRNEPPAEAYQAGE